MMHSAGRGPTGLSQQPGAPGQAHASVWSTSSIGLEMPGVSSEPRREDHDTNVYYPAGGQSAGYSRAYLQHGLPVPAGHAGIENTAMASAICALFLGPRRHLREIFLRTRTPTQISATNG